MSVRSRIKEFEALAQANDGSDEKKNEASKSEILYEDYDPDLPITAQLKYSVT